MSSEVEVVSLEVRRELFSALVAEQDKGTSVKASRETVAQQFGVDVAVVAGVENEGLDNAWPPFGRG